MDKTKIGQLPADILDPTKKWLDHIQECLITMLWLQSRRIASHCIFSPTSRIAIWIHCQAATFTVNGNTGTTRSWDVKVTQYACGDMDSSGPPGCLQYYTETYGTIEK